MEHSYPIEFDIEYIKISVLKYDFYTIYIFIKIKWFK